jgi:beta-galactosidase
VGPPAGIKLRADRASLGADAEDVVAVAVEIVDAQGRVVPTAGHEVRFALSGPARLIGVGNGDPASHESDKEPARRAFNGACMAIVQSTRESGAIRLEASSHNLTPGKLELEATPASPRPFVT